jgi:hypothetical protein
VLELRWPGEDHDTGPVPHQPGTSAWWRPLRRSLGEGTTIVPESLKADRSLDAPTRSLVRHHPRPGGAPAGAAHPPPSSCLVTTGGASEATPDEVASFPLEVR